MNRQWTSLAAFLALLLFAGAADGLMDQLGLAGFAIASAVVMSTADVLLRTTPKE